MADSDYNSDEAVTSEGEEGLNAELKDIQEDLGLTIADDEQAYTINGRSPPTAGATPERRRSSRVKGLGLRASSLLVDETGIPYPGEYHNPLLDMFADDEPVQEASSSVRRKSMRPSAGSENHPEHRSKVAGRTPSDDAGRKTRTSGKSVRFDEVELPTPATIRLEASDDCDGDDFQQFVDADGEMDESDKENATPGPWLSSTRDVRSCGICSGWRWC